MVEQFEKFLHEHRLFNQGDKILLAFSGGPDSVALAHLLYKKNHNFALAHVNFHLRGKEADKDQVFSREFAARLEVEFFTIGFDTEGYADEKGLSIEEAARELRYNWFDQLADRHGFDLIATAHNADDNVETVLHNLSRGTGIKGLLGIPVKRGKVIRPLLFAFKDQILQYCHENNLPYRIDRTNEDIRITRNRIRHRIIPEFEILNSSFKNNVLRTVDNLKSVYALVRDYVDSCLEQVVERREDDLFVNKAKLKECKYRDLVVYELFTSLGFGATVIERFMDVLFLQPGKRFSWRDYEVINDREHVIITRHRKRHSDDRILIRQNDKYVDLDSATLRLEILDVEKVQWRELPATEAALDLDKLIFPLILRHWRKGDYFYPLGMGGRKKLSDFFVDQKISVVDKDKLWILESGGEIAWIVGYRIDDRFKVTQKTKKVLKLHFDEEE